MDAALVGLLGLGGLYTIANQEKKRKPIQMNDIPTGINQTQVNTDIGNYSPPAQAAQKYSTQQEFKKQVKFDIPGPPKQDFSHNNMVPFFGGKIRGRGADLNLSESILDNMTGSGSQQITKKEQAPLFRPEDNMQWAHGTPNNSDFFQSRVNPSIGMKNVKPWKEEQVGPGLNQGYNTEGSGGFNSGMQSRNSWLPKNVNELRVKTNPKVTYNLNGHQGPANSENKQRGDIGMVDKNLPDTYFINSPERYFTTKGVETAPAVRGIEKLKDQSRINTTVEYSGAAGRADKLAGKAPENYTESRFPHTYGEIKGQAHTANGVQPASDTDYGRQGYKPLPNHRSTVSQQSQYGAIGGAIGAIIAPVMDVLRPSRKENVIGNKRLAGNVQRSGKGGQYIYDPNDVTRTTIREMTEDSPFHLNVEKSGAGGEYVIDPNDKVKTTMKQTTENSPFHLNFQNQSSDAYKVSTHQPIANQRDTTNYNDFSAAGNNQTKLHLVDQYTQQRNNNNKQHSEASVHGNMKMLNSDINQRNNTKTTPNPRLWVPSSGHSTTPGVAQHGALHGKQFYQQDKIGTDRINPDVLNAFKKNPYTHSLQSHA